MITVLLSRYGFRFEEKGGDDGWGNLQFGTDAARDTLLSTGILALAGFQNGIGMDQMGSLSMFTASTAWRLEAAYNLHVYTTRIAPSVRRERYWGLSLCVLTRKIPQPKLGAVPPPLSLDRAK